MPCDIVPVILAGGEGRRLRPLTHAKPKPFLKLFSKYSLLQMALQRGAGFSTPLIVCDHRYAEEAQEEARELGVSARILAEPSQRGTAAAICCAAFLNQNDNPVLLIMPSDHVINDTTLFRETVHMAADSEIFPVIFGKRPERAAERFGYIRSKEGKLESFIEKPPMKIARKLVQNHNVFWNTGIWMAPSQVVLALMAEHAPDIFEAAGRAVVSVRRNGAVLTPEARRYAGIPSISIDHAVMERLSEAVVLPLETGWHDVGSWDSVFALKLESVTKILRHEPRRSKPNS
jgi:mannose-1-phosphate guanylyltransferase